MAWLANHATIDMHPWTSRTDAYRNPTYALVDIDPGTGHDLRAGRRAGPPLSGGPPPPRRERLSQDDRQAWAADLDPDRAASTRSTRRVAWVEGISRAVGATLPDLVSWEWEKTSRRGRARLDYTQNAVNKTLVAPYAVRPVRRRQSRRRSPGMSSTTLTCARADGTSGQSSTASASAATCSPERSNLSRNCRLWIERRAFEWVVFSRARGGPRVHDISAVSRKADATLESSDDRTGLPQILAQQAAIAELSQHALAERERDVLLGEACAMVVARARHRAGGSP